jgi:uncharacterized membrane protein HdeD (DUF308 family)
MTKPLGVVLQLIALFLVIVAATMPTLGTMIWPLLFGLVLLVIGGIPARQATKNRREGGHG